MKNVSTRNENRREIRFRANNKPLLRLACWFYVEGKASEPVGFRRSAPKPNITLTRDGN